MDTGRMHCFCVATKEGQVIYERFYDRLSEIEKGEVRAALQTASSNVRFTVDEQDFVAAFRTARFAFLPSADCVYYLMGSGEYEDLALVEVLRIILLALKDALGRPPTAQGLLDKYGRLCVVVDEVINEGIVEATDREVIRRGLKNRAMWE